MVSGYFDFAEVQAIRHRPMYMSDYVEQLDNILRATGEEVLTHAGKISHAQAMEKAKKNEGKGILEMVKSNSYVQILKSLTRARAVTREMCEALLERIDIDKDHNLKITVKYRDEFADLLRKIGDLEAEIHDVG